MKNLILALSLLLGSFAHADWFFDPYIAVGFNPAQGTHFRGGVDVGLEYSEQIRYGIGAFASAGERPGDDRELGIGPFVGFVQPLTSFLIFTARQEIDYIDMHVPQEEYRANGTVREFYTEENGVASVTSAALHVRLTPNFIISGGYRFVLGLTNEALDDDRSGAFAGLSVGI